MDKEKKEDVEEVVETNDVEEVVETNDVEEVVETNDVEEVKESTAKLLNDLKEDFAKQIKALKSTYQKELAERDDFIKSLLNGDDIQNKESIAERINKTRIYKKW